MSWDKIEKLVDDIKTGKTTATQLVKTSLERIEESNEYNAIVTVSKEAIKQAEAIDEKSTTVSKSSSNQVEQKTTSPKTTPLKAEPPKSTSPKAEKSKEIIKADPNLIPEDLDPKLKKVVIAMMEQEPPITSQCDYVLINNKLYILVGGYKADLRKGGFNLEEVKTLPEGVFSVENYFPRILISKKKILGVELWARR